MKQSAQLKTIKFFRLLSILVCIQSISLGSFAVNEDPLPLQKKQKKKRNSVKDQSHVVHVLFRNFYTLNKGRYDKNAPDNVSGDNDNEKWNSIVLLSDSVALYRPVRRWFNNPHSPSSMVVQFNNFSEAAVFFWDMKKPENDFIVRSLKLERYRQRKRQPRGKATSKPQYRQFRSKGNN